MKDPLSVNGFNAHIGFDISVWEEDFAELSLALQPMHLNRSGIVHGGVLATLMDVSGGLCGCYCNVPGNVRRAVTLNLSTNFVAACRSGTIVARAHKRAGGRRTFFIHAEVRDDENTLLADAHGTYQYTRGSETLAGLPMEENSSKL